MNHAHEHHKPNWQQPQHLAWTVTGEVEHNRDWDE